MLVPDMRFTLMCEDQAVATIVINKGRCALYRLYSTSPSRQLFPPKYHGDIETVERVLRGRCWEEGRADSKELLDKLGLDEYNPYLIVQKTKGVSTNDKFWFKFDGDEKLTWESVNPRRK